jgi:hypothetical protein
MVGNTPEGPVALDRKAQRVVANGQNLGRKFRQFAYYPEPGNVWEGSGKVQGKHGTYFYAIFSDPFIGPHA